MGFPVLDQRRYQGGKEEATQAYSSYVDELMAKPTQIALRFGTGGPFSTVRQEGVYSPDTVMDEVALPHLYIRGQAEEVGELCKISVKLGTLPYLHLVIIKARFVTKK